MTLHSHNTFWGRVMSILFQMLLLDAKRFLKWVLLCYKQYLKMQQTLLSQTTDQYIKSKFLKPCIRSKFVGKKKQKTFHLKNRSMPLLKKYITILCENMLVLEKIIPCFKHAQLSMLGMFLTYSTIF